MLLARAQRSAGAGRGRWWGSPHAGVAFGILWVGKFLIINHLLFHRDPHSGVEGEDDIPVF